MKYNAKKIADELLKGNGYFVVPKLFSKKDVKTAREQIISIAKSYKATENIKKNMSELAVLSVTNHVWNLIDKHAVFRKRVQHDLIIEVFSIILGNELKINIGENPERLIHGLVAPIRLISTMWIFDHGTKTLFSSDMFSHISQKNLDGPWISDKDELTTTSFVRSFLLNTRYWWLEGVDTGPLREGITEVFNKFDIHTIAPGYGTILTGKEQVEKQFNILDEVLRDLDSSVVKASYVPRNLER